MIRRLLCLVGTTLIAGGLAAVPASADTSPVVSPIQAGNTGALVGTATFTRTLDSDGNEGLQVDVTVPAGMDATILCLSHTAFTSRVNPALCPDRVDQHPSLGGATTDHYFIGVGTDYLGETIYAQLHVNTGGNTAFAGWTAGNPFYGNVAVDGSVIEGVPAAPILGSWMPLGLAALFVAGIGAVAWRYRSRMLPSHR